MERCDGQSPDSARRLTAGRIHDGFHHHACHLYNSCEGEPRPSWRLVSHSSAIFRRGDGVFARPERRAEEHGNHHHGAGHSGCPDKAGGTDVGDPELRDDDGARNFRGWLAHHEDHGPSNPAS